MNPELRGILTNIPIVRADVTVSLHEQLQMRFERDLERLIRERAARMIASEISRDLFNKGRVSKMRTFDGDRFTVEGSFLTYDQLYNLVFDAYSLGMRNSPAQFPQKP